MAADSNSYAKIKEMLQAQETFPFEYIHKAIGKNTALFLDSAAALEKRFPLLRRESVRASASQAHVSITWILSAQNADEVIDLLQASQGLQDLVMVL
ncbi:MAG: hypothetical protein RJB38_2468 [Pseudomonadota bacterium]|jgi:predicted esterase YcpF (UPF0227 family)